MRNKPIIEPIVSLLLITLLLLLLNPFQFWMPDMMTMAALAILLVAFGIYAGFVLREAASDEREMVHRMHAGRVAYLTGASFGLLGIFAQALTHQTLDPWLVGTLVSMLLAKLTARFYSDRRL